jgi:hypothetical protein
MRSIARLGSIGTTALVVTLGLVACGSSGSSSSGSTSASSPQPARTSATGGGSSPGSVTVDTNFSGSGSGDLCTYAKQIQESGIFNNAGDLSKEQFDKYEEVLKNVEDKAPAEIKDDVKTFEQAISGVRAIYAKYNYDATKIQAALSTDPDIKKAIDTLSAPEYQAASGRLSAYFTQVCGISGS